MKTHETPVNTLFFETGILSPTVKVNCCWVQAMDKVLLWLEIWAMAGPGSFARWFVTGMSLVQSIKEGVFICNWAFCYTCEFKSDLSCFLSVSSQGYNLWRYFK